MVWFSLVLVHLPVLETEPANTRVEGLDAQHLEDSRGGRVTRGCRERRVIWRIQGQPEVAGRRVEGLDAQHPQESRGGRTTGGWRNKGGGGWMYSIQRMEVW